MTTQTRIKVSRDNGRHIINEVITADFERVYDEVMIAIEGFMACAGKGEKITFAKMSE